VPASGPTPANPKAEPCPDNMSTVGLRATSKRACVNTPGYYYAFVDGGDIAAIRCPADTYG
jgi:hypothetical protein